MLDDCRLLQRNSIAEVRILFKDISLEHKLVCMVAKFFVRVKIVAYLTTH